MCLIVLGYSSSSAVLISYKVLSRATSAASGFAFGRRRDPLLEMRGEDVHLPLNVARQQLLGLDVGVLHREVQDVIVDLLEGVDRLAERVDGGRLPFDVVRRDQFLQLVKSGSAFAHLRPRFLRVLLRSLVVR